MTDANQASQQINLQKLYLKDVSVETPNSPAVFTQEWQPNVNVDLATHGSALNEGLFESVLTITVTAKSGNDTAFLVEVQQAGIFEITGFDDAQRAAVLGIFCPTTLFPFAREAVAELVSKAGFPQLLLNPVNFEAMYAQSQQQKPSIN